MQPDDHADLPDMALARARASCVPSLPACIASPMPALSESEAGGSEAGGSDWEGEDGQVHHHEGAPPLVSCRSRRTDPAVFSKHRKQHYNMKEQLRIAKELLAKELAEAE